MSFAEFRHVTFSYDGKTNVLEDVSFALDRGEVVLLSGHSGEGKSTVLSILSGIIPNVTYGELSGEVLVDGENIKDRPLEYVCRKVGVVLQNADEQIVHKTVEDEIAFGCENLAFAPDKIEKQIEIVTRLLKLPRTHGTRTLSGGQKQRLITASTLAMGQTVLILDEPLANLDKDGAAELMGVLRSLAKAGYLVLIVEHRLDMVLPYVDRVYHIGEGKIRKVEDKQTYLSEQTNLIADTCPVFTGEEDLFTLEHLAFSAGEQEILKDIHTSLKKGARTVILGENGCGKTTLLRLLARLQKPTSGRIIQHLDGKFGQKSRGSKAWFKSVGVVYQNPDYQLFMPTVRKEIAFGSVSPEVTEEVLDLFELREFEHKHPHSLSEGQKRRLSIAAVVACRPEVLILDEPTVGQDYRGLCKLVEIINRLHRDTGNTVITVTHDMRCCEALCDKALWIDDGKIFKEGGKELVKEYFSLK